MERITDKAIMAIKGNNVLIGRLMIAHNRGQNTIENWMASKDSRLTLPVSVRIIHEESGLATDEILEDPESEPHRVRVEAQR